MFKRKVQFIGDILPRYLRDTGLEMPLQQRRLVDAWEDVAGAVAARYTAEKFIKNQTLFVHILNPALRQELSMRRSDLIRRLNERAGAALIFDIRLY